MKRAFYVTWALVMASTAGAGLYLSVNGVDTDSIVCHMGDIFFIEIGNKNYGNEYIFGYLLLKGDSGEWTKEIWTIPHSNPINIPLHLLQNP